MAARGAAYPAGRRRRGTPWRRPGRVAPVSETRQKRLHQKSDRTLMSVAPGIYNERGAERSDANGELHVPVYASCAVFLQLNAGLLW